MHAELKQSDRAFVVDVVNDNGTSANRANDGGEDLIVNVPEHIQPSLDGVLDYYTQNGQKPEIKLSGSPLNIVSEFIAQVEATLPESLLNSGRDIIDFVIASLCQFSRDKSVNHITFNFIFSRKQ